MTELQRHKIIKLCQIEKGLTWFEESFIETVSNYPMKRCLSEKQASLLEEMYEKHVTTDNSKQTVLKQHINAMQDCDDKLISEIDNG